MALTLCWSRLTIPCVVTVTGNWAFHGIKYRMPNIVVFLPQYCCRGHPCLLIFVAFVFPKCSSCVWISGGGWMFPIQLTVRAYPISAIKISCEWDLYFLEPNNDLFFHVWLTVACHYSMIFCTRTFGFHLIILHKQLQPWRNKEEDIYRDYGTGHGVGWFDVSTGADGMR